MFRIGSTYLYRRFWIGLHIHKKEMHAPAVGISKDTNNIAQTFDAPLENLKKTEFFFCVCIFCDARKSD